MQPLYHFIEKDQEFFTFQIAAFLTRATILHLKNSCKLFYNMFSSSSKLSHLYLDQTRLHYSSIHSFLRFVDNSQLKQRYANFINEIYRIFFEGYIHSQPPVQQTIQFDSSSFSTSPSSISFEKFCLKVPTFLHNSNSCNEEEEEAKHYITFSVSYSATSGSVHITTIPSSQCNLLIFTSSGSSYFSDDFIEVQEYRNVEEFKAYCMNHFSTLVPSSDEVSTFLSIILFSSIELFQASRSRCLTLFQSFPCSLLPFGISNPNGLQTPNWWNKCTFKLPWSASTIEKLVNENFNTLSLLDQSIENGVHYWGRNKIDALILKYTRERNYNIAKYLLQCNHCTKEFEQINSLFLSFFICLSLTQQNLRRECNSFYSNFQ